MQFEPFSITATGTGSQSYTGLSFLPVGIIWLSGSYGTNPNTIARMNIGFTNASIRRGQATYVDGSTRKTDRDTTYEILIENSARVFEGQTTSFDNPAAGVYGFTINQNTNSINPTLYGVALG